MTLKNVNTEIYGPNGKNVAALVERISKITFYRALGDQTSQASVESSVQSFIHDLDAECPQVVTLTKEQLSSFLESMRLEASPLWEELQQIPIRIAQKLEETNRSELFSLANDVIPEQVFHDAYDGSFNQLESVGRTAISLCTGAAMYITGLAVAWELLADLPGWEKNPFLALIEVLEQGHLPLGLYDNQFYVI